MKFRFQKINGKADVNWEHINTYISRWKDGTWFDQEITRHQHTRSDPLRKYFFSTVLPKIEDHLGYEPEDDFYKFLKAQYFKCKKDTLGIYRNVPSVFGNKSKIKVSEKKLFTDWVIRKAAERGCYIPDPKKD